MIDLKNCKTVALGLVMAAATSFAPAGNAALMSYSQNFEGMDVADTGALGADGWLVFGNVFGPGGTPYFYGYGPFPAPNNCTADPSSSAFSCVAAGEGGPPQGEKQLVVLSDYNNTDHGLGYLIESNTFQEQIIESGDVGKTMYFTFDAKKGDIGGSTTALAFIKTLAGPVLTNFITLDTTSIATTWDTYFLSIFIDSTLNGQILQFGFANSATNYEPSGMFYDNVCFNDTGVCDIAAIPVPAAVWLFGSGLLGLVGVARRRKALS